MLPARAPGRAGVPLFSLMNYQHARRIRRRKSPILICLDSAEIRLADEAIKAMAKADDSARRLMSIPGIGPVTASAIAASVQDVSSFSGPREFAAYLGLTPRQNPPAASNDWVGSRRWATVIYASCWWWAPMPSCTIATAMATLANLGVQADGNQALQAGRGGARQQDGRIAYAILRARTIYKARNLAPLRRKARVTADRNRG